MSTAAPPSKISAYVARSAAKGVAVQVAPKPIAFTYASPLGAAEGPQTLLLSPFPEAEAPPAKADPEAEKLSTWQIQQLTNPAFGFADANDGPACAMFLRYGGASATDPAAEHDELVTPMFQIGEVLDSRKPDKRFPGLATLMREKAGNAADIERIAPGDVTKASGRDVNAGGTDPANEAKNLDSASMLRVLNQFAAVTSDGKRRYWSEEPLAGLGLEGNEDALAAYKKQLYAASTPSEDATLAQVNTKVEAALKSALEKSPEGVLVLIADTKLPANPAGASTTDHLASLSETDESKKQRRWLCITKVGSDSVTFFDPARPKNGGQVMSVARLWVSHRAALFGGSGAPLANGLFMLAAKDRSEDTAIKSGTAIFNVASYRHVGGEIAYGTPSPAAAKADAKYFASARAADTEARKLAGDEAGKLVLVVEAPPGSFAVFATDVTLDDVVKTKPSEPAAEVDTSHYASKYACGIASVRGFAKLDDQLCALHPAEDAFLVAFASKAAPPSHRDIPSPKAHAIRFAIASAAARK